MAQINIGDRVLCYSCEKCRIEKRPSGKSFEGIVTEIKGNIVTVRHDDGHSSYNDFRTLEVVKSVSDFIQDVFVDEERAKVIRMGLVKAYCHKDSQRIHKAVFEAQKYVDDGGDFPMWFWQYDDSIEDYSGSDADMLAEKYLVRLLHDRTMDDDEDKVYIATGLPKFMRMTQPVQLALNF